MAEDKDTDEFDFYYADLQVTIIISSDGKNAFTDLTDNQRAALQQIIYLALNTFLYTRALHTSDDQT